jgi:hypothetical protein
MTKADISVAKDPESSLAALPQENESERKMQPTDFEPKMIGAEGIGHDQRSFRPNQLIDTRS